MVDETTLARVWELSQGLPPRPATAADIPALVNHRRRMFEDMYADQDAVRDRAGYEAMDAAYAVLLRYEIPAGSTRAWVIQDNRVIAASGALKFTDWLPRPDGLRRGLVYVHSVYTVPEYRRQGLARHILNAMIDHCRANGWPRISLHASNMGRGLYAELGFKPTNEMRLVLD